MADSERMWQHPTDFYVFSIGLSLGVGTVWGFPYVSYSHGGGAFLFAYVITLFLVGLPLLFMELVLGQFSRVGAAQTIRRMVPLMSWLGYATLIVTVVLACSSLVVPARAAGYLAHSLIGDISWGRCGAHKHCENWSSEEYECFTRAEEEETCSQNGTQEHYVHCGCVAEDEFCELHGFAGGQEEVDSDSYCVKDFPVPLADRVPFNAVLEEHFKNDVITPAELFYKQHIGGFGWEFWIMPVVLWTALFFLLLLRRRPYRLLLRVTIPTVLLLFTCELIYAAQLDGAVDGVKFFVMPDWDKFFRFREVWHSAACQVMFSLPVGFGCHIHLASLNPYRNNVLRDTIIICLINALTSFYIGIIVSCVVGHLAYNTKAPVEKVIREPINLPLVAYSTLTYGIPLAPFWASLQFATVIVIILFSACGAIRIVLSSLLQLRPGLKSYDKRLIFLVSCVLLCMINYIIFFFDLAVSMKVVDQINTDWMLTLATFEACTVAYMFGIGNFMSLAKRMGLFSGACRVSEILWTLFLGLSTPLLLLLNVSSGWLRTEAVTPHVLIIDSSWITDLIAILWVLAGCLYNWATVEESELEPGETVSSRLLNPTSVWFDRGAEAEAEDDRVVAEQQGNQNRGETAQIPMANAWGDDEPAGERSRTCDPPRINLPEMPPGDYPAFC